MVVAIAIAAIALAAQAVASILIFRMARRVRADLERMGARAEEALQSADETLKASRRQAEEMTAKVNDAAGKASEVLDLARSQLRRTDEFLAEATQRARVQLDRLELVLDDSISRMHETIVTLNEGVLGPVRQVSGVVAGMRAALDYLLRGGRPNVSQATTDEEMFI